MKAFGVLWFGQAISLLGTAMTHFGLTLWIYDQTGKATPVAMMMFSYVPPQVVLTPFIVVLVDRANRRLMMAISDSAAAVVSTITLVLLLLGQLEIW